ncbi:MAG: hypothetical protein V1709_08675 [Planctomycetota bacterium]
MKKLTDWHYRLIILIIFIVAALLALFYISILTGCGTINYKPTILKNPVSEKINTIELTGTATGKVANEDVKLDLILSGEGTVVHIVKKEEKIMEETNYWAWDTIKGIFINIGTLLWIWLWHIIAVTLLIALMTELLGLWNKAGKIGKRGLSIFWGIIGVVFYCLVFKADFWVAVIFNAGCVLLANFGWEIFVNQIYEKIKTKIKK